ncbi:MAG TPA: VOC family protein [Anaerolineales bacterium]|nr:VOC family protein [Anaerolineales bacterium]
MDQTQTQEKTEFSIHPRTMMGHISLTVANLENQIEFYTKAMGFKLHWRDGTKAGLGAGGPDLLLLTEEPDRKKYNRVTGLYHVAYLFPNRRELAIAMARLFAIKYPNSPTDHIMTKTTYLDDLEGNGIELYCESPEDGAWTFKDGKFESYRTDGTWSDGREALDVEALFKHIREEDRLDAPVPTDLKIGHVHLHVRDVDEAVDFYHGIIGFDIMGVSKPFQMGFVSAGGYHHHLGLNTWQGRGAPPPPQDAVGLRYYTIDLPTQAAYDEVVARVDAAGIPSNQTETGLLLHDPSQNGLILRVASIS